MKCELCQKADAQAVIYRTEGDKDVELYVCKACAAAERAFGESRGINVTAMDVSMSEMSTPSSLSPDVSVRPIQVPEELSARLDSLLGDIAERIQEPALRCAQCGHTLEAFHASGMLGCCACFETFKEHLKTQLVELNHCEAYGGEVPRKVALQCALAEAKQAMRRAVENNDGAEIDALEKTIERLKAEWDALQDGRF